MPSGIMYPGTICIIGTGVVVEPKSLLEEMKRLEDQESMQSISRFPPVPRWYSPTISVSMKQKKPGRKP